MPFSPPALPASAVQSVTEAVAGLPPEQVKGMRVRCNNGSQYKSGEFRAAMNVLGLVVEYIRAGTLSPPPRQQNGHIELLHNTPRRGYVRPYYLEIYQDAEARLARAARDYNANRVTVDRVAASGRVLQALGKEQWGGGVGAGMTMAAIGRQTPH